MLGVRLKMIADPYIDQTWVCNPGLAFIRNPEELFSDVDIDAIFFFSSSFLHADQIIPAAARLPEVLRRNAPGYDHSRYRYGPVSIRQRGGGGLRRGGHDGRSGIGEAGDIDSAITTMRLSSGALAVIDNSR